jgi:hypothetical protein
MYSGEKKRRINAWAIPLLFVCFCLGLGSTQSALGVSATSPKSTITLKSSQRVEVLLPPPSLLPIQLKELPVYLKPTRQTLRRRLEATLQAPEVAESVRLSVKQRDLRDVVSKISGPSLRQLLAKPSTHSETVEAVMLSLEERREDGGIEIDARDLNWIDLSRLSSYLRIRSRVPFVEKSAWDKARSDAAVASRLATFFGSHWSRIRDSENDQESSHLETKLAADDIALLQWLPPHMREIYGRYSSFRGRNCFATALMFADGNVVTNRTVNIVREQDHHLTMINSDEFSNALWRGYSLLTAEQITEGLRFGDVVAFVDTAKGEGYRSMLHAAVHVGGEFYFHKPSKSASSPVEFTRWYEMVRVWQANAGSLSYLAFRKNPLSSAQYLDNQAFSDKISWTP